MNPTPTPLLLLLSLLLLLPLPPAAATTTPGGYHRRPLPLPLLLLPPPLLLLMVVIPPSDAAAAQVAISPHRIPPADDGAICPSRLQVTPSSEQTLFKCNAAENLPNPSRLQRGRNLFVGEGAPGVHILSDAAAEKEWGLWHDAETAAEGGEREGVDVPPVYGY
jgi:hypothetical protein